MPLLENFAPPTVLKITESIKSNLSLLINYNLFFVLITREPHFDATDAKIPVEELPRSFA